jgi:hypothetical protein
MTFVGKSRRVVEYVGSRPPRGRTRAWAYDYRDLAKLLGTTADALRARVHRGTFAPNDLESICREWARKQGSES